MTIRIGFIVIFDLHIVNFRSAIHVQFAEAIYRLEPEPPNLITFTILIATY